MLQAANNYRYGNALSTVQFILMPFQKTYAIGLDGKVNCGRSLEDLQKAKIQTMNY